MCMLCIPMVMHKNY
ncbi:TPA: hypothetical protein O1H68_002972 [Staphylococcus aureus]|nr:hypothetical protein [Staphylococcus pseudintermedius]HCY1560783.1 hypothetical protein [Staphylococcus aureus]HEO5714950.1 hypothetical protein [Streptococcus agalactiae]HBJ9571101.1 hypothetical protein [Staphylococcus pseudintermedius]HBJ9580850.1 hypothetical protein [Staphylococcus pseudintermedius]